MLASIGDVVRAWATLLAAAALGLHASRAPAKPPAHALPRPPQFVVVSFDGSGDAALLHYWRGVAKRAQAHFTFFLSGAYLLSWATRDFYHAPRHERGVSDIGFTIGTPEPSPTSNGSSQPPTKTATR